ncbi:MAG: hypothetical protein CVU69_11585 [Deltaproteobacteria bacterium HGW-Deltaproteobacteria-4]|nr:MAG: hypothetical protein CVU69_11585 [Deltaproteobacteria bacterium HGW-Deltaproteobacteria-4]
MTVSPTDSNAPPATTAAGSEHWLIVDQQAAPPADFDVLLPEIERRCGVDLYTARQRLLGRGYSLFLRGSRKKLTPLLELLHTYTIPARLLVPLLPKAHPSKLQSLRHGDKVLTLIADNSELTIHSEVYVVAVFADLSGTVVANGVKQLLVRNAYQGADAAAQRHDEEALCRAISRARPVLDLYLLDAQGQMTGAVRAHPGRYDPEGLGDARTLSAGLNLLALIEISRRCAKSLTLRSDFGLANLPGCQLDAPLTDANLGKNLVALSRFGALAAQFVGQVGFAEPKGNGPPQLLPVLPLIQDLPPLLPGRLSQVDRTAAAVSETARTEPGRPLPAPPEDRKTAAHPWLRFWRYGIPALFFFGGWTVVQKGPGGWWPWLWQQGVGSGLLPALLAGFLLWRAFTAVRLKRQIENTPVSRIRSLATGMVEVLGRAERCCSLVTPVTQTPCIYYRLLRYRRDNRNDAWRLTSQRTSGLHPFWLSDSTGKVLIDPLAADLRPGHRQEGNGDGLNNAFFGRESQPDSDEKWVEESIPEGEMLYVLGFAAPRQRSGESLHEATSERLRDLKKSPELRQRFDKNNDGKIGVDEWDEARRVVAGEVAKSRLQGQQERRKQQEFLVIGASPRRSLPFLIAQTINEKAVTRTLWWQALALLLAGLLLSLWALRQLLHFLPAAGN